MMQCNRSFFLSTLCKNIEGLSKKWLNKKKKIQSGINNCPYFRWGLRQKTAPFSPGLLTTVRYSVLSGRQGRSLYLTPKKMISTKQVLAYWYSFKTLFIFGEYFLFLFFSGEYKCFTILWSRPRVYPVLVLVLEHSCNVWVNTSIFFLYFE